MECRGSEHRGMSKIQRTAAVWSYVTPKTGK